LDCIHWCERIKDLIQDHKTQFLTDSVRYSQNDETQVDKVYPLSYMGLIVKGIFLQVIKFRLHIQPIPIIPVEKLSYDFRYLWRRLKELYF
jgi:hypothetical protein